MNITSGNHLKAARALAGLSRAQLAKAAEVGCDAVKYWERKADIRTDDEALHYAMHRISDALKHAGVTITGLPQPGVALSSKLDELAGS